MNLVSIDLAGRLAFAAPLAGPCGEVVFLGPRPAFLVGGLFRLFRRVGDHRPVGARGAPALDVAAAFRAWRLGGVGDAAELRPVAGRHVLGRHDAFQKLADHPRADLLDLTGRQGSEGERTVGQADQAIDLQADRLQHLADLAVLAFRQADRDPDVLAAAGPVVRLVQLGVDGAVLDALEGHAVLQRVELGLRRVAKGASAVAADPGVAGRLQRARQLAVIGQQQQALGVQVETPDRDQPGQVLGQRLEHRRPALGIAVGGHQAGRLVVAEDPRRLALGHQLAVDGEKVSGRDLDRRGGQHLAVDRHAAGLDQPLDLAARRHPGPRQRLGHPLARAAVQLAVLTVEVRLVQGIVRFGHFRRPSKAGRISRWAFS